MDYCNIFLKQLRLSDEAMYSGAWSTESGLRLINAGISAVYVVLPRKAALLDW